MTDKEAKRVLIFLLVTFWTIGVLKSLGYSLDTEWISNYLKDFQIR